ncbi:hypothetical protein EJV46_16110 [Roseococcus sp. SYP-B2431]|uniref:hypothetical protein n=1 Tax=Roseococcus sp. SYP-B2431 TaxID=2496640 RepID=UPI00103BFB8E|nr:hypothetical protein [Roseococcus sp. SYP-B2431]TCH97640.1 hypothetical protein EJV46_16110 [Roseococcus sp. SYP-B2431]
MPATSLRQSQCRVVQGFLFHPFTCVCARERLKRETLHNPTRSRGPGCPTAASEWSRAAFGPSETPSHHRPARPVAALGKHVTATQEHPHMNFEDALARKEGQPRSGHLFQQLIGLPDRARAKLAAMRSRRKATAARAKLKGAATARRIEPTLRGPKAADTPPPTYTAESFARLAPLAGAQWSALWEDKAAAGPNPAIRDERARMLAILGSPEAAKHPPLAAHLAFATDLNPAIAINLLSTAAPLAMPEPRISLSERMAGETQIRLGSEPPQPAAGTPEALAARVLNSTNRARPHAAA